MARPLLLKLMFGLVLLPAISAVSVTADPFDPARGAKEPTLQDMLEKGLRARQPSEFQFIEKVVGMVDRGELPRSLVESTFLWSLRQPKWPFPYFQRGLRERARRIGVEI